jgi:hypothetical protein
VLAPGPTHGHLGTWAHGHLGANTATRVYGKGVLVPFGPHEVSSGERTLAHHVMGIASTFNWATCGLQGPGKHLRVPARTRLVDDQIALCLEALSQQQSTAQGLQIVSLGEVRRCEKPTLCNVPVPSPTGSLLSFSHPLSLLSLPHLHSLPASFPSFLPRVLLPAPLLSSAPTHHLTLSRLTHRMWHGHAAMAVALAPTAPPGLLV